MVEALGAIISMLGRVRTRAAELSDAGVSVRVIVESRRMSCIYFMLRRLGIAEELIVIGARDGVTTELLVDRYLDVDPQFPGVTLLIDDSLVLGSTLLEESLRISPLKPGFLSATETFDSHFETNPSSNVECFVPCIHATKANRNFVRFLGIPETGLTGAPLELSDVQMRAYSIALTKAMFWSGTPYFTDFPTVRLLGVSKAAITNLLTTLRWMVVDTTTSTLLEGFDGGDLPQSFSFVPTQATFDGILTRGCEEAMAVTSLLKVRVFITKSNEDGWDVAIVPLGIPSALLEGSITKILECIVARLRLDTNVDNRDRWERWKEWTSVPARHRLVQMYLSSCLLAEFWKDLQGARLTTNRLTATSLEHDVFSAYFGQFTNSALAAFEATVKDFADSSFRDATPFRLPIVPRTALARDQKVQQELADQARLRFPGPEQPKPGVVGEVPMEWSRQVLAIFGSVGQREVVEETQLNECDIQTYINEFVNGSRQRLVSKGISIAELNMRLNPSEDRNNVWTATVLSLAMDQGNDVGSAVPVTGIADRFSGIPLVCRWYRCGESSFIVENDRITTAHRLLSGFLREKHTFGSAIAELDTFSRSYYQTLPNGDDELRKSMTRYVEAFPSGEKIKEHWRGRVLEIKDELVIVKAQSELDDTQTSTFQLRLSNFKEWSRKVAEDDEVEWHVWEIGASERFSVTPV